MLLPNRPSSYVFFASSAVFSSSSALASFVMNDRFPTFLRDLVCDKITEEPAKIARLHDFDSITGSIAALLASVEFIVRLRMHFL